MNFLSKKISLLLVSVLILLYLPAVNVYGLSTFVAVAVEKYENGKVTLSWDDAQVSKIGSVRVYSDSGAVDESVVNDPKDNTCSIDNLENDKVYDIKIEVYSDKDKGGSLVGEGFIYFLPAISFYSEVINQDKEPMSGGGFQSGTKPKIKLKWKQPQVWGGTDFVDVDQALGYMQDTLNYYYDGLELANMGYKINISRNIDTLVGGASEASVTVENSTGTYKASVLNNPDVSVDVKPVDSNGYMSFDLIGRSDTTIPTPEQYGLPDTDIIPGSIYYMGIKPVFKDSNGSNVKDVDGKVVNIINSGNPVNQDNSMLSGKTKYVCTPIRFGITKDGADNVYMKIYKINQGSLSLPKLYYEVQTNDDETLSKTWQVKRTLDGSYFNSEYAVTVLSNMNPHNKIYYRVVVKSDSKSDEMSSNYIDYIIAGDVSKPPLPTEIRVVKKEFETRESGGTVQKTTNVTFAWKKPINWDELKANTDPDKDIVYQFLLNTSQDDVVVVTPPTLEAEGLDYGKYQSIYRRVKYVSSKDLVENGDSLEYTMKGFELFKGVHMNTDGGLTEGAIQNNDNYPARLLPNKEYYIQMYSTKGENYNSDEEENMSDRSISIGFTTLAGEKTDIPVSDKLGILKNDVDLSTASNGSISVLNNIVQVEFDKLTDTSKKMLKLATDDSVVYELYMNSRTNLNTFVKVGSTDESNGDVAFTGVSDAGKSIQALLMKFGTSSEAYSRFGEKLMPNTTYYFLLKVKIYRKTGEIEQSKESRILAVTTLKGDITKPDQSDIRPKALTEFAVSADSNGNKILTGTTAEFEWIRRETNVRYEIIATSEKVSEYQEKSVYGEDSMFKSFEEAFQGTIMVDPESPDQNCTIVANNIKYKISKWLFPNKLYYISIRAISKDNGKVSSWVSIPVTTNLIEAPTALEVINYAELVFDWEDLSTDTVADDFSVYIKKNSDSNYSEVKRTDVTINKDGTRYYTRLKGLESNTVYDVNVYKGSDLVNAVHQEESIATRNETNEIDIKWTGTREYEYEVAMKLSYESEYVTLSNVDYFKVESRSGTQNSTDYYTYNMRIKLIETKLPDGSRRHLPLKSDSKYYIKVRAVKVDPIDISIISYSKYISPVDTRTEFNQAEYDKGKLEEAKLKLLIDKVDGFAKENYWKVLSQGKISKLLVKQDKLISELSGSSKSMYTLDLSGAKSVNEKYDVYIPIEVLKIANKQNISLKFEIADFQYILRPKSIDISSNAVVKEISKMSGVKEVYVKITFEKNTLSGSTIGTELTALSANNKTKVDVLGSAKKYKEQNALITNALTDKNKGVTVAKTTKLLNKLKTASDEQLAVIDNYVEQVFDEIQVEIGSFVESKVLKAVESENKIKKITKFDSPVIAGIKPSDNNVVAKPYVNYVDTGKWNEIKNNVSYVGNYVLFNVIGTGSQVLLSSAQTNSVGSQGGNTEINKLISKYNLTSIFESTYNTQSARVLTFKEIVSFYEKLTNNNFKSDSYKDKATEYGLYKVLRTALQNDGGQIQRQQASFIIAKIYADKLNIDQKMLKPKRVIFIDDEKDIDDNCYNAVFWCIDMGIFKLENGKYLPEQLITREELMKALLKMVNSKLI